VNKRFGNAQGAERRGAAGAAKESRRRKYESDPAALEPEDQPTGRSLAVDPVAVADLCKALGFTR